MVWEIWPKIGQNGVPKRFFEKISRNTEKMLMSDIIGNFVADIVFGMEVLAHHPEELSLEILEFTTSSGFLHFILDISHNEDVYGLVHEIGCFPGGSTISEL